MFNGYKNNSDLKNFSRSLRKGQTETEKLLWSKIRSRQLNGYKFYRQYAIDHYILDFYCPQKQLGIELDGSQHLRNKDYDEGRTRELLRYGVRIIRFWDNEIFCNITGVLSKIAENLNSE